MVCSGFVLVVETLTEYKAQGRFNDDQINAISAIIHEADSLLKHWHAAIDANQPLEPDLAAAMNRVILLFMKQIAELPTRDIKQPILEAKTKGLNPDDDKIKISVKQLLEGFIRHIERYPIISGQRFLKPVDEETHSMYELAGKGLRLMVDTIQVQADTIKTLMEDKPYITSSEAIQLAKVHNRKLSFSTLSRAAVKGGPIRFEQIFSKSGKPYRKNVYLKDVKKFIMTLPSQVGVKEIWEVMDAYYSETKKNYSVIHKEKEANKGSNPRIEQGYTRLAHKISDPDA